VRALERESERIQNTPREIKSEKKRERTRVNEERSE
jgi:hypothetical protein